MKLCLRFSLTLIFTCLTIVLTYAQSASWTWAKSIGAGGSDRGNAITTDPAGNVYTTGFFSYIVDFDPGPGVVSFGSVGGGYDVFITKMDAAGNLLWAKQLGGASNDVGTAIASDSLGNIYITGWFSGTGDFDPGPGVYNLIGGATNSIFVAKYDSSGGFIWAKVMEKFGLGGDDFPKAITLDSHCNVLTTGTFYGTVDFNPGTPKSYLTSSGNTFFEDVYISKLDSAGNYIWAKRLGGQGFYDTKSSGIAADADDNVYTIGNYQSIADFDPDNAVTFPLYGLGQEDIYISKLDSNGIFVWAKSIGGTATDNGNGIATDVSGNIYATGSFRNTVDFDPDAGIYNLTSAGYDDIYYLKLNAAGNFVWAKRIGLFGIDIASSIAINKRGNNDLFTTGYFKGPTDFDPDTGSFMLNAAGVFTIFVSSLDSAGHFKYAVAADGANGDYGNSIAADTNGAYITGHYYSPAVTFGPYTIANATVTGQGYDLFIAKVNPTVTALQEVLLMNGFNVYPNPSCDYVHIAIDGPVQQGVLSLIDMTGKICYSAAISTAAEIQMDFRNYSDGIYLLQFSNGKEMKSEKVMVFR